MSRYKLVIEYDGADYVGWQKQLNGLSVQECLESALAELFSTPVQTTASGRTDSGVHAKGQVVHFDVTTSIPTDKIPYALNTILPRNISALSCETVSDNFNARFDAKRKTYCYKLYSSSHRHPTLDRDHAHTVLPLDVEKMREGAKHIIGEHDFKCFEAAGAVVKITVRTIYSLEIIENKDKDDTQEIEIYVCGNGFLYNMVRIIAGTLVYIGLEKIQANELPKIIESRDR
ncbi:MAG TPA: tRNA pseudouridine(38-40) synthase TruA, partial [Clostridia bacterium]|nr:tRNA pseudouridine(38-40) synthase TruA [Clostridia bacterium]